MPEPALAALVVRPSAEADLAAIAAIYRHHVLTGLASFEEVPPDPAEMGARRDTVLARGLPHLVAERSGVVVGYAYAGPYRSRSAYRFAVETSVYVKAQATHQGIGRRLLAALIEQCEAQGCRQMVAVIGDSGNAGSIALHAGAGFRMVGTLEGVGFKFGRWLDCVLMQRRLGPGTEAPPGAGR